MILSHPENLADTIGDNVLTGRNRGLVWSCVAAGLFNLSSVSVLGAGEDCEIKREASSKGTKREKREVQESR